VNPGLSLGDPAAVPLTHTDFDYLVAANIDGQPAVWAMRGSDDAGYVVAVNEHAEDVSGIAQIPTLIHDDEVADAVSCVATG
jgi:hypothetical protein